MPTKERRLAKVVKKASSPSIGYKTANKEYLTQYADCNKTEQVFSGRLWYNKDANEDFREKYPFHIRDEIAGLVYLRLTPEEAKPLRGFVEKVVHVLGKNTLENKVNALLVKEVRQCNGKCEMYNK